MNLEVIANANGSTPAEMVAVESTDQPSTNEVKLFEVTVAADVQLRLTGCVNVYATDEDQAEGKVQAQIDNGTLDLEMEDDDFGCTLRCSDLGWSSGADVGIDSVEIVTEHADPFDVLQDAVEGLESQIAWDAESLGKRKAFLESLLGEGDDEQAVAA